jgi:energy-coupling factor transport system substrate-specific component
MIFIPNSNLKKILKFLIPFVFIPIATIGGTLIFDEKRHLFLSLAVAIMTVVLFLCGFEKKEIGTRRRGSYSLAIAR